MIDRTAATTAVTTPPGSALTPLELWGGIECTYNRVGDEYFDQIERSGHAARAGDLDRFAELGIRALRYPVLWERTAPDGPERGDWSWADERLGRLRDLGIRPILGLVHHGSGPPHTSLIDPDFVSGLAAFARAVAERYPWVTDYTPVNEPLTTARFSGLYGHWYPHGSDRLTFARALLIQCRAVACAMEAVRRVNPQARLVQTEDLGRTRSTRKLAYQAKFENERRWLTFDLLCGRVDRDHPMWSYLRWAGVEERELAPFLESPCPPDILGINHYLTSERFLDERLHRYPRCNHGGNEHQAYADVEAVRVLASGPAGPRSVMRETWKRYGLPVAVTEVHLGCTREEQLRWFYEVWEAACTLRARGADVRAVTAWSLLGTHDWATLMTRRTGHYEPGAFDLRGPEPRPTALAGLLRDLAAGREPEQAVLAEPGWWRRPQRLLYPPVRSRRGRVARIAEAAPSTRGAARPIVISAAQEGLGSALARACEYRGLTYHLLREGERDLGDAAAVRELMETLRPWAVVHAGGYLHVERAEREPDACLRENAAVPASLARECARWGAALLVFSSDLVFDGARRTPYLERDPVAPLGVYGRSKAEAEKLVLEAMPRAIVVRAGPLLRPWEERDFLARALGTLAAGRSFVAADDTVCSPTFLPDLVQAVLDLLIDGEAGLWHLANPGAVTWTELARRAAELAGLDPDLVEPRPSWALGLAAPRPLYSALASERASLLPPLEEALQLAVREWKATRSLSAAAREERSASSV